MKTKKKGRSSQHLVLPDPGSGFTARVEKDEQQPTRATSDTIVKRLIEVLTDMGYNLEEATKKAFELKELADRKKSKKGD